MSTTTQVERVNLNDAAIPAARRAMIDSQLRTSGVNDPVVLARMAAIPREDFVPGDMAAVAYSDRSISVGDGARLAAPLFYGKVLDEAACRADDKVLIISAAPGYLKSLIQTLVADVNTVSPADAVGKGKLGSPYSLLLIDGAVEQVPARIVKTLAEDGRAVLGLSENSVTRLASARRSGDRLALLPLAEIGIPKLGAFDKAREWTF